MFLGLIFGTASNTFLNYSLLSGETGIHQSSKPVCVGETWLYIILLTIYFNGSP